MEEDLKKEVIGGGRFSGGYGWSIEFSTPDCQNGWSVIKAGTGQSSGCYLTKEAAEEALRALAVTEPIITKNEEFGQTKQDIQEGIGNLSFWGGSFAPKFGSQYQDAGYLSTYNSPPEHDGEESVGYGNRSGSKGKSNS